MTDREKHNATRYAWLEKNRDRVNARRRENRAANIEKVRKQERDKYKKNPEPKKQAAKRYRNNRPGISGHMNRKRMYGLSADQYQAMLDVQAGLCAICSNPETARKNTGDGIKALAVDHDHITGRVRELLCGKCNALIAYAGDDPAVLIRAAEYLSRHRGEA